MALDHAKKPMTIAQAKRAFKKRGAPQPTEKEKRQAARAEELDKRAQAIREKEGRKKMNAAKRAKKAAKDRETRHRMGRKEPTDEKRLSPRQTRMGAFFRTAQIQGAGDLDSAEDTTAGSLSVDLTTDAEHSAEEHEVGKTNSAVIEGAQIGSITFNQKSKPDLAGRKRKREDQQHSKEVPSTQPQQSVLTNSQRSTWINKNRLYVPPSQGSNEHKRQRSYDLHLELPLQVLSKLNTLPSSPDETVDAPKADDFSTLPDVLAKQPGLDELAIAAELFSSGMSVTDLLSPPPKPASGRTSHTNEQIVDGAQISGAEEQTLYELLAEFKSSQLAEATDSTQPILDEVGPAQTAYKLNEVGADALIFSDGLEISCEEVIKLEHEALQQTNKVVSSRLASSQKSLRAANHNGHEPRLQGHGAVSDRLVAPDESFGFGSFEFTSQELKEIDL